MIEHAEYGTARASFRIGRGEDQAADACVQDGSGAHRARLEGAVEVAAFEAVVAECLAGGAEGDDLGVSGGIGVGDDAIAAAGDDFSVAHDDAAYGHFAGGFSEPRFGNGELEETEIGHCA